MRHIHTPEWVKHAIFYQIFPDRFARGRKAKPPLGVTFKPWGSDPAEQGYQGGDLYGVVDKLDYLRQLGVNAIYLNPIFSSASNHRYHTFDYFQVDPLLGGNDALRKLIDEAHHRGMKVVLDGVFNHASRGFWAFHHILENGGDSPYLDWFLIQDWPLRPYHSDDKNPPNYEAWWNLPALPKFNIKNAGVRQYILDVARYWLEFGIDGWRLDVPHEIEDDAFWRDFRHVVKDTNPQAYICGEIWGEAKHWLQGDMFDAVMNYTFSWSSMSYFGARSVRQDYIKNQIPLNPLDSKAFQKVIDKMHSWYDWEITTAQLNMMDSHDMARALWILQGDKAALQLAVLFQMTMPGAPCIYYGSEIGLDGADDPLCREAYPWDQPELQDQALLRFYQQVVRLRRDHPVLRTGKFRFVETGDDDLIAYNRHLGPDEALVVFNRSQQPKRWRHKADDSAYQAVWPSIQRVPFDGKQLELSLPPMSAMVLVR